MKPTVFIQANDKQLLGAKVAAHALRRNSRSPEEFDVHIIRVEEYPALYARDGQSYLREGRIATWRNDDLQSFTPTRFLPPQLSRFQGRAVVIDPDVFALADVMELFTKEMEGKAIFCRRIIPTDGRRPYWATSVMLLDCAKLTHWRWEECIEEMFARKRDYRDWMSLALEPQETIGVLGDEWNHYDVLSAKTKMLHNTGRMTQPWKTGLPIDFSQEKAGISVSTRKWGFIPNAWIRRAKCSLTGKPFIADGHYQQHPDPGQERLFFTLLQECIDSGSVSDTELLTEIERLHIRRDALQVLTALRTSAQKTAASDPARAE